MAYRTALQTYKALRAQGVSRGQMVKLGLAGGVLWALAKMANREMTRVSKEMDEMRNKGSDTQKQGEAVTLERDPKTGVYKPR